MFFSEKYSYFVVLKKKESRGMLHHYFIVGLGMNEMTMDTFNHGGLNVTGFRLVDHNNTTVKRFLDEWSKLDRKSYAGAGFNNISVSWLCLLKYFIYFILFLFFEI